MSISQLTSALQANAEGQPASLENAYQSIAAHNGSSAEHARKILEAFSVK